MQKNNWQNSKNYRKIVDENGKIKNIIEITVGGARVEVGHREDDRITDEVYDFYVKSTRKIGYSENGRKRNRVKKDKYGKAVRDANNLPIILPPLETALDLQKENNYQTFNKIRPVENEIIGDMFIEKVEAVIGEFDSENQQIAYNLLFYGMTVRECAELLNISKSKLQREISKIREELRVKLKCWT